MRDEHLKDKMRVIHYLKAESHPGDQIYVWGFHALIYYLTGLPSPTRFVVNFPLMSRWGPFIWRDELMGDLDRARPAFIVVERKDVVPTVTFTNLDSELFLNNFPQLNAFISGSYTPVLELNYYVIYRRRGFPEGTKKSHEPAQGTQISRRDGS